MQQGHGQSGNNRDYVLSTVKSIEAQGFRDAQLHQLAAMLHDDATLHARTLAVEVSEQIAALRLRRRRARHPAEQLRLLLRAPSSTSRLVASSITVADRAR